MGTLIRHTGFGLALPVVALPVPVVQPSFRAALIAAVGFTALPEPRCPAARFAAVALSAVAVRADEKLSAAIAAQTKPRAKNRFAVFHHAHSGRTLTTAIVSWQVRTIFNAWWPCHKGCQAGTPPVARRGSIPPSQTHYNIQRR